MFCRRACHPNAGLSPYTRAGAGSERDPRRQTKSMFSCHFSSEFRLSSVPCLASCYVAVCCRIPASENRLHITNVRPLITVFHPRSGRPSGSSSRRKCLPRDFDELQPFSFAIISYTDEAAASFRVRLTSKSYLGSGHCPQFRAPLRVQTNARRRRQPHHSSCICEGHSIPTNFLAADIFFSMACSPACGCNKDRVTPAVAPNMLMARVSIMFL